MSGFVFSQVVLRRPTADGSRPVLDGVNLTLDAPVSVITGPSGSGKTTLLRMLNGLLSPDSGTITFRDRDLGAWSPRTLRTTVGLVAQQPEPIAPTAREELMLAAELSGRTFDLEQASDDAAALDLEPALLDQFAGDLSVGERQRLAIVRALCAGPEVLVLDEPTSAQDEPRAALVHGLLAEKQQAGLRLVIVEHRLEPLATYDGYDAVTLADGKATRR